MVDGKEALERIFSTVKLPLMVHCEDTDIINHNMEEAQKAWGDDPQVNLHSLIRSEEACLASSRKAVELARKYGTRLHIAHLSTAEELELIPVCSDSIATNITAEACVGHLYFTELDYQRLGARIKVNPSIKTPVDQFLLRASGIDRWTNCSGWYRPCSSSVGTETRRMLSCSQWHAYDSVLFGYHARIGRRKGADYRTNGRTDVSQPSPPVWRGTTWLPA